MRDDLADPGRRVVLAAAEALKARQRRVRGRVHPQHADAMWLRPNWPEPLLLGIHRERIVEQLTTDAELRSETQIRLRLAGERAESLPAMDITGATDAIEALRAAFSTSGDPRATLEVAAVHIDARIARAASPYLLGTLSLPVAPANKPREQLPKNGRADVVRPGSRLDQSEVRELRRQLRQALATSIDLQKSNDGLAAELAKARTSIDDLRRRLPTNKELKALANAADGARRFDVLKRQLNQERRRRDEERQQLKTKINELESALSSAIEERDSEQRGRRRLENELGDAGERARRLHPLVLREARNLNATVAALPLGKERTRTINRVKRLETLAAELAELYPPHEQPPDGVLTDSHDAHSPPHSAAFTRSRGPRVTAIGGAGHIGGSALLIEAGSTRILVDAGLRPDVNIGRGPGPEHIADAMNDRLDAVVITHAHADHAGFVPWVVERQRRTEVLCSRETAALLPTVWNDSVRVMRAEADAASARGDRVNPPYGDAEVSQAEDALRSVRYGQAKTVGDVELTLFKAGHILGAAGVVVRADDMRIVVTGDIDDRSQSSVGAAEIPPKLARGADLLVIETTYCDRNHEDRDQEGKGLMRRAEEVLSAGGRILIPAFGLGRAQEIALLLSTHMPEVEVLVDGLARDISDVYAREGAPEIIRGNVRKVENRTRQIRGFHNGIVITTSGMLTGGAAIPWAQAVLPDPTNALFLCGHQDEEAPGRQLEELAAAEPGLKRQVHLRDETGKLVTVDVQASIHRYNLSAHADSAGLMRIIKQVDPRAIMLVHGEVRSQAVFRQRLEASGYTVVDNREAWDPDAVVLDTRLTRWRHGSRLGSRWLR